LFYKVEILAKTVLKVPETESKNRIPEGGAAIFAKSKSTRVLKSS